MAAITRQYRVARAWVLHNEAHRRMSGQPVELIQISLREFAAQWAKLNNSPKNCGFGATGPENLASHDK